MGPTGPKGDTGATGATGPQGPPGPNSATIPLLTTATNTVGSTAMTELAGQVSRVYADFRGMATMIGQVLPNNLPRSDVLVEYSLDDGATWAELYRHPVAALASQVLHRTAELAIPTAARALCLLRVQGHGGGGIGTPWQMGKVLVAVRS